MSFSIFVCMAARQDQTYAALCAHYQKMIRPFAALQLADAKEAAAAPCGVVGLSKAENSLLARWPRGAFSVALGAEGRTFSSVQFAAFLGKQRQAACPLVFMIGAAAGLSPALKARCDTMVSLSALTLPHQLCRLVLLEQIYRGFTILQGHPYHK